MSCFGSTKMIDDEVSIFESKQKNFKKEML